MKTFKGFLDWKGNIRRKLAHNKSEVRQTGGGDYNQYVLTRTEESLAVVCGLYKAVEGIKGAKSFGIQGENVESSDSENSCSSSLTSPQPSTSQKRKGKENKRPYKKQNLNSSLLENSNDDSRGENLSPSPSSVSSGSSTTSNEAIESTQMSPKRSTSKRTGPENLNFLLQKESQQMENLGNEIAELVETKKHLITAFENKMNEISTKLEDISGKYDEIINLKKEELKKCDEIILLKKNKLEEMRKKRHQEDRHHIENQKSAIQKIELQLKKVELEKMKLHQTCDVNSTDATNT